MISFGVSIGLTTRAGVLLAEGRWELSWAVSKVTCSLAACLIVFYVTMMYIFRDQIVGLYTTDPAVVEKINEIWPWVCLFSSQDGTYIMAMGLNKAMGKQKYTAGATIFWLWCVMIPSSYYFAVVQGYGLKAILMSMVFGYMLYNCTLIAFIFG